MIRQFLLSLVVTVCVLGCEAHKWAADSLTGLCGYETATIIQPRDYSGDVVSTVIRKLPASAASTAVLYIHGFNDYFFQTEMGDRFVERGYAFYAVDLRKYGRSYRKGQRMFEVRNFKEYFADLDSAFSIIAGSGIDDVILVGHSTGGLVTSYYMALTHNPMVRCLILNSPFLDWNLSKFNENIGVPIVSTIGSIFPDFKIKQPGGTAYSESLLKGEHGEWSYDTSLKLRKSPDVTAGWINAVNNAQCNLNAMVMPIGLPILVMHSARSVDGSEWNEEHNRADGVLDVNDIARRGWNLSPAVTEATVEDGLHDLVLSRPEVREAVYDTIFNWLDRNSRNNETP